MPNFQEILRKDCMTVFDIHTHLVPINKTFVREITLQRPAFSINEKPEELLLVSTTRHWDVIGYTVLLPLHDVPQDSLEALIDNYVNYVHNVAKMRNINL